MLILLLLTVILFVKTVHVAYSQYKRSRAHILNYSVASLDMADGYEIAANHSFRVFKTTLRLSATAFIYVISFLPIILAQFYEIYNGPIRNPTLRLIFHLWFDFSGNIIGTMNIVFYGYFSKVFRREMVELKNRLYWRVWEACYSEEEMTMRSGAGSSVAFEEGGINAENSLSKSTGIASDSDYHSSREIILQ